MKKGIDISKHNKKVDWEKAKHDIDFVIIRAGYGVDTVDEYFEENIKGAIAHNIPVGCYWFLYGFNDKDAELNAIMFDKVIRPYKEHITLKVWCDWEYDSDRYSTQYGINQSKASRTQIIKTFCNKMIELGYECGVYANPDYLKYKLNDVSMFPLWLAYYNVDMGEYKPYMWQYTSQATVAGIKGNVDMNYCYGVELLKYPSLKGWQGISIVSALEELGYNSSFASRKKLWKDLGQKETYKGTAEQNKKLIVLLGGEVTSDFPSLVGYKGFSLVDGLKKFGYKYDMEYRTILWNKIGETGKYKGSALQNIKLLNYLKSH